MNRKNNVKIDKKNYYIKTDIEVYRSLRIRIQLRKKDTKIISIVSNNENDGKSQIAYSLAESYEKTGKRVLLVDANLRNPQLSIDVNQNFDYGLFKLLKGIGNVQDNIIKMDTRNLYLLPTQKEEKDSTEILENILLPVIFENFKKEFDFIIIDTLAIENGMDALLISKHCDGVVFVVVENKTKKNELIENKIIFDDAGINIIGAVYI